MFNVTKPFIDRKTFRANQINISIRQYFSMKIIFTLSIFAICSFVNATDYYISNSGDDLNNSGLSEISPWKTIGKVNSAFPSFNPGDRILFKCGDTFYGTITIMKSGIAGFPISIGAYGIGEKPVITGFKTVKDWKSEGNGIYSTPLSSEAQTNMVRITGKPAAMGRYPDTGSNLVFSSFKSGPTSITASGLGDSINWTGAEAVINVNDWSLDRCLINSHSGDVLTYTNLGSEEIPTNSGRYFFIQNDLRCLTKDEEWYHSISDNKFYIYGNPSDKTIAVSCLNYLIYNQGYDYIDVDGLALSGASIFGIYMTNGNIHFNVQNSNISFIGESGIRCDNGSYHTYDNNFLNDINRGALYITNSGNIRITNNTIKDIGIIPGGSFRATENNGMFLSAVSNSSVQYNSITNTGYNGIYIRGGNTEIKNNYIKNACMLLDDGAGIYTSGRSLAGLVFSDNIILNSGAGNRNARLAEGIYLDEYSANITVKNNSIANCLFSGIKNHKGNNNIITNNTCFNNGSGIYLQNSSSIANVINNLNINGNMFIAKSNKQIALRFHSLVDDIPRFGSADNNYYSRPIDNSSAIYIASPSTGSKYTNLKEWQTLTRQDLNSQKPPVLISDTSDIDFYYNATKSEKIISLAVPMADITGKKYQNSVTLQPFTSIVLLVDPDPSRPVVIIHSSAKGSSFVAPATVTIEVQIANPSGTIKKVELYNGTQKISETTTTPYIFTLKDLPEGAYSLTAVATDNLETSTTSSVFNFIVTMYDKNSEYFNLYPNPNNGCFSIDLLSPPTGENYSIAVVNLAGKTVYQRILTRESESNWFDLSHLSPGTYIVMIKSKLIITTQKFIKA